MSDTEDTIIKKDKKRPFIKRVLPRSLLGRSLLILVTPILLIQLVSAYIFLDNHWQKMLAPWQGYTTTEDGVADPAVANMLPLQPHLKVLIQFYTPSLQQQSSQKAPETIQCRKPTIRSNSLDMS